MNKRTRYLAAGTALLIGLSVALALILTAPQSARAAGTVRYAAPNGLTTVNCDGSWANACTLQRALAVAVSGDEIWVKEGVHYPGTTRTAAFALKNGVAIYGGFAGTETQRSQRNWQTHRTILSGDIDKNDITDGGVVTTTANIKGSNAYHVISSTNVISTAVLDGFFITAGQANGSSPNDSGGGVYNNSSSPTLTNVTFSGNTAGTSGGGMYNSGSSPTLTNVTFSGNTATNSGGGMDNFNNSSPTLTDVFFSNNSAYYGGGMDNDNSSPTLRDVTFVSNSADSVGGGMHDNSSNPTLTNITFSNNTAKSGGGMYNEGSSSPTLTHVTFNDNSVSNVGGGMCNWTGSSPTLTDVTFSDNTATNSGGGMYNQNSNPALTDVTFISNSAYSGGGMYNSGGSSTLRDVIFSGNSATLYGGGMCNSGNSPTLTNVAFSGNSASSGGGMYDSSSSPLITNVTFSGNSATNNGGGMYNSSSSNPTLTNVIMWGNTATNGQGIYNSSSNPTIAYSDVQNCGSSSGFWVIACGTNGGGNIAGDPRFEDADGADNIPGTADDNLRLQLTSPCIDAGKNAAVPAGVTTDLDGNPRFVDIPTVPDTGNGTPPIVDMGAYEARLKEIFLPLVVRNR